MPANDPGHADPSRRDPALIAALVEGLTQTAAAERLGCSRATVKRRMADPAFKARLAAAREKATEDGVTVIGEAFTVAVSTLVELMGTHDSLGKRLSPYVRHAAAKDLMYAQLRYGTDGSEDRLRDRVAELARVWAPLPVD